MKVEFKQGSRGRWFYHLQEDNGDHGAISGIGPYKSREEAVVAAMRHMGEAVTMDGLDGLPLTYPARSRQ